MIVPFKRYFDFKGRSRRMEYWMFMLMSAMIYVACAVIAVASVPWNRMSSDGGPEPEPGIGLWIALGLAAIYFLASLIPSIAVTVRRFHDQDMSGWFYFLRFIPYVGGIVLIVFMCIQGTKGENRFGYDPLGRGAADTFM
ncbi:MAG: DUF805 domain-containing protein [Novosphingobium sp.]